ncbi:MAG: hypothetical protein LBG57_02380 [Treponema sp.]|jgi:hypothetical protein|nr:hypothetical protein [Treponema sp.]
MGAKHSRLFALALFPCALALTGFGARESGAKETAPEAGPGFYRDRAGAVERPPENPEQGGEIIRVSGRVRLVGSAMRSSLVVSGEEGDWYIEGGDQELLTGLQQRNVTVEGRGYTEELVLANGQYLGKRLILRDARIIAQE